MIPIISFETARVPSEIARNVQKGVRFLITVLWWYVFLYR